MCGVKLQWWVDAFEQEKEENKEVGLPTSQEDKKSSC